MTDVFVLGAGFSVAIDPLNMVTTAELGAAVIAELRSSHQSPPRTHSDWCDGLSCDHPMLDATGAPPGANFELWLSRLAVAQPYLNEHDNANAFALYSQLSNSVARQVLAATKRACVQVPPTEPSWFEQLLRSWHQRHADVITFNYDTLVEARWDALGVPAAMSHPHTYRDLGPIQLPQPDTYDGGSAGPAGDTFSYMKLHGSINWYWDPLTRSADSMVDAGLPATWPHHPNNISWRPEARFPGRTPVIVPPTTSKAAFFDNPLVRQLWRHAFDAVRAASRLIVIGYSLPVYDLLVSSMLGDAAHARGGIDTIVVDPEPDPIAGRLGDRGFHVTNRYDAISKFVNQYP